jgi:hypothetical protein
MSDLKTHAKKFIDSCYEHRTDFKTFHVVVEEPVYLAFKAAVFAATVEQEKPKEEPEKPQVEAHGYGSSKKPDHKWRK